MAKTLYLLTVPTFQLLLWGGGKIKILIVPQISFQQKVEYKIRGEEITAKIEEKVDTFDFSGFPNGRIEKDDDTLQPLIETNLGTLPIIDVYKENNILFIELFFWVDTHEEYEEMLDLGWLEVNKFEELVSKGGL